MIRLHHVDARLIVAEKPAGLLSVPGRGPANQDSVIGRVQVDYPDALSVHRLDMATSGLIVLARGPEAHRTLSIAFAERRVAKRYVAVAAGSINDEEGEIDLPLIADWPNRPRQRIDHEIGKPSLTRYRVVARGEGTSRVELEPVTGRSHQLRVHLMAMGHPILGDAFYAPEAIRAASPRLLLHAEALALPHPQTGDIMHFQSKPEF